MSHITRISTNIKDLDILKRALSELGYRFEEEHKEVTGYGGANASVDLKVIMPSGYHFGFERSSRGTYRIVGDWWGVKGLSAGQVKGQLGNKIKQIEDEIKEAQRHVKQQYTIKKVVKEVKDRGFDIVDVKQNKDKSVVLEVLA